MLIGNLSLAAECLRRLDEHIKDPGQHAIAGADLHPKPVIAGARKGVGKRYFVGRLVTRTRRHTHRGANNRVALGGTAGERAVASLASREELLCGHGDRAEWVQVREDFAPGAADDS